MNRQSRAGSIPPPTNHKSILIAMCRGIDSCQGIDHFNNKLSVLPNRIITPYSRLWFWGIDSALRQNRERARRSCTGTSNAAWIEIVMESADGRTKQPYYHITYNYRDGQESSSQVAWSRVLASYGCRGEFAQPRRSFFGRLSTTIA